MAAAGLESARETTAGLDLLAMLQYLEVLHETPAGEGPERAAWAERIREVLSWGRATS